MISNANPTWPASQAAYRVRAWHLSPFRWLKRSAAWSVMAALVYCAVCGYLWGWQDQLIFFPDPVINLSPEDYGLPYQEVRLPVKNATNGRDEIHGWWIPARSGPTKVLLYLHGNSGNIGSYLPHAVRFHHLGFSVLLVDYRGYGESRGDHPSESRMYEDADAAWNYLIGRGLNPGQVFIYGHSLGGAVAVELASRHSRAAGLIVEGTFTSMSDIVQWGGQYRIFPVDWLLRQRFDSIRKIRSLKLPMLFIHGTADRKIPYQMSERLYAAAISMHKRLVLIPEGDHSNSARVRRPLYVQTVQEFAEKTLGNALYAAN